MKRWMYILTMMLVGIAIFALLVWAAACHNVRLSSSSPVDRAIAAFAFWSAIAIPIFISLFLSCRVVGPDLKPLWPVIELIFIGSLLMLVFGSEVASNLYRKILPNDKISERVIPVLVIAAIGTSMLNACLGVKNRKWLLAGVSVLAVIGGTLILFVFNGWAIYWE